MVTRNNIIGILIIMSGLFMSPSTIVEFLRSKPIGMIQKDLMEQLLLGAVLFKIGIVILGFLVIAWRKIAHSNTKSSDEITYPVESKKTSLYILTAILLAATGLRLYGLNYGLWFDEILVYVNYVNMPFGEIISSYETENQHVLFNLLAHASFLIFGDSAWSLRLPAVVFGIGSLLALYLFGRQVASAREALFSVALLAFSYQHIWFSQNARGYTGLLFWSVISSWLFVRGLREVRPNLWLMYALSAALGIYTQMTMFFVVAGHFCIYIIQLVTRRKEVWPRRWDAFFIGFCLAAFFTLFLYALILPQVITIIGEESNVTTWKNPIWTIIELIKGIKITKMFAAGFVAAGALIVFSAGLLRFKRQAPIVIQLFIIPVLIGSVVTMLAGHPLWPRFFFFAFGFGSLIVISGIVQLGQTFSRVVKLENKNSILLESVLCILLIFISSISVPAVYAPKQDFLGAIEFIDRNMRPGDTVVTVGLTTFPYKELYKKVDWKAAQTHEELNAIRSKAKRTWLLYTIPLHLQFEYPEIMSTIKNDFAIMQQFKGTLGDGSIWVCRSDNPFL